MIRVAVLSYTNRPRRPTTLGGYQLWYDALGNLETMAGTSTDTALHRMADEPSPWLQCCHDQHSSTRHNPQPQDHDDSHDPADTRRWRSLQAKIARTSSLYQALSRTLYEGSQGALLGAFHSFCILYLHSSSRAPRASLRAALHVA
jgi:hypothetical protein